MANSKVNRLLKSLEQVHMELQEIKRKAVQDRQAYKREIDRLKAELAKTWEDKKKELKER